jgi:thiol reductant ABC exporter CydC subunit
MSGRLPVARLLLAALLSAATCLSAVALMGVSAWLIARAAQRPDASTLTLAAVGVRSLALARALLRYGERLVGHDAVLRVVARLRVSLFDALRRTPDRDDAATDVSVLVSDVDAVQDLWLRVVIPYGTALLVGAAVVVGLWQALPAVAVLVLVAHLSVLLAVPVVAWFGAPGEERLAHWRGEQHAAVVDLLHGAAELLVFGGTTRALLRSEAAGAEIRLLERAAARRTAVLTTLLLAVQATATLGAGLLCAGAVDRGELDPVTLVVVVLVVLASFEPLVAVVDGAGLLRRITGALRRVRGVLAGAALHPPAAPSRGGQLVLDRVVHRYPGRDASALRLQGLVLPLQPGISLGVVGGSGAGKSTLLRALAGELRPTRGQVRVGESVLADLTSEDRARCVALASQDAHVFDSSLADNLRVARPDATDVELREVIDVVGLGDWVAGLADGLDTELGHRGTRMSGGQRKRLCVARALLSPAPVLLLDEPTEGLEPDAADALLRSVLGAARRRAVVVVTHRVVALHAVEEVLVLERGVVVARGSASALLESAGLFRDAWQLQRAPVCEVVA